LPLRFGDGLVVEASVFTFDGLCDGGEHVAFGLGDPAVHSSDGPKVVPLVRLHSECLTGDVFGSQRCDRGPQLREAVERISDAGGYLLYLRQEGRGIGRYNKIDGYALAPSRAPRAGGRTDVPRLALRDGAVATMVAHGTRTARLGALKETLGVPRGRRSWLISTILVFGYRWTSGAVRMSSAWRWAGRPALDYRR
jgi:hypothetical protein